MSSILLFHRPGHDRDALVTYLARAGFQVSVHEDLDGLHARHGRTGRAQVTVVHEEDLPAGSDIGFLERHRVLVLGSEGLLADRPGLVRVSEPYYLSRVVEHLHSLLAQDVAAHPPAPASPPGPPPIAFPPAARGPESLLRGLAHALNNPLSAAMGWLQLLAVDMGERDARTRALNQVRSELGRLERLIQALAMIGGRGGAAQVPIDLEQMVSRLAAPLRDEGLPVALEVQGAPLPPVEGDPVCFELMLELILSSFLEERSRARELEIRLRREGGHVELRVSDEGGTLRGGVDPSDLALLLHRLRHGRALGISLAYTLVAREQGGDVRLESEGAAPATLLLRIPAAAGRQEPVP